MFARAHFSRAQYNNITGRKSPRRASNPSFAPVSRELPVRVFILGARGSHKRAQNCELALKLLLMAGPGRPGFVP